MKRITLLTLRPETLFDTLNCALLFINILCYFKTSLYICNNVIIREPLEKGHLT